MPSVGHRPEILIERHGGVMVKREQPDSHLSQPVRRHDHILGPVHAQVTLIEYGDFECPYAREETRIAMILQDSLRDHMRFVFRHFPLTAKHPHAQLAAKASEAAATQGRFWEMAELLFRNQDRLTEQDLHRYAEKLGLDTSRFKRDLRDRAYAERVQDDVLSGRRSGVTGTPTFFINDRRYDGADDLDSCEKFSNEKSIALKADKP